MQKALLISEKPSLTKRIEEVYNQNRSKIPYEITFATQRGHLVSLLSPKELDEDLSRWSWDTLPIEPENYGGWKYKVIKEKKQGNFLTSQERYQIIKKELDSGRYDFVINAGDPDQEGELLVRIVLAYAKNTLPIKRFWTNDLTDDKVLDALIHLKDDEKDPMLTNLLDAAYARQHSDWRFGMNISRASTLKMGDRVSCGRVKTPILAIVCKRENEIRNFKPSTCYGVKADYAEKFDGTLFDVSSVVKDDENASEDQKKGIVWFDNKKDAEDLINALGKKATVVQFTAKRTETYAPKLYKLATAQIDAGRMGYNDAATLAAIQKLYEAEYLSYPRTDCEYLSSNEDFDGILDALSGLPDYSSYCSNIKGDDIARVRKTKKWINDKALEDSGHSAIRPTTKVPDMSSLSKTEQDIYKMIASRFIAIFLPPLVQNKTLLVTDIDGKTFQSTGKTLVDPGYAEIFGTAFNDTLIPEHQKGDILDVDRYRIAEKTTTCPKRYTSPDLIAVCENPLKFLDDKSLKALGKKLKIGTPATRSSIIRQLIDKDKYLAEKKEKKTAYIYPTETGEAIIKNLDGLAICRVDMTGLWEEQLELIRNGEKTLPELETEMKKNVRDMVEEIKNKDMVPANKKTRNVAGKCPKCGRDVMETDKAYYCTGYKEGCKVGIFKESHGLSFDFADFEAAAKGESIKKGSREFYYDFSSNKLSEKTTQSSLLCPCCSEYLQEASTRYLCRCGFATQKVIAGHELTKEDLNKLAEDSHTDIITDFVSKKGSNFPARLKMKDKRLEFEFEERPSHDTGLKCPCCGKDTIKEQEKLYACSCGFKVWKTISQKNIDIDIIRQLSENKTTEMMDGFVSKVGKPFSCMLVVNKRKKTVVMEFSQNKKRNNVTCTAK